MKKILVLFTGGTIACRSESVMDASESGGYRLIEAYWETTGDETLFECAAPLTILSENHTLSTMETLCRALWTTDFSRYSGIIITHGSDTLSYLSALLSLCFSGAGLTIVLTAAGLPIDDPNSNGVANFTAAVDLVKSGLCGVYTVYQHRDRMPVYVGDVICEADGYFEEFSPFGQPFGFMQEGRFVPQNPPMFPKSTVTPFEFTDSILIIKSYPGMDYSVYNLSSVSAVLHILYHSGTACVAGENTSFLQFAKRCRTENVPLYVLPFRGEGADVYASADRMRASGAIPMERMSLERAYASLLIELGGGKVVFEK